MEFRLGKKTGQFLSKLGLVEPVQASSPSKSKGYHKTPKKGAYNMPYAGASNKRSLSTFQAPDGDAISDTLESLQELRNRSRDLDRNAPLAKAVITTLTDGVIGDGLEMQPAIDREFLGLNEMQAREWEAITQQQWRLWSESKHCDFYKENTFAGLQRLALRSMLTSGDVFVLLPHRINRHMPYDLRIQLIEADRICNPDDKPDTDEIAGGIAFTPKGVKKGIYVVTPHPGNSIMSLNITKPEWQYIPFYGKNSGRLNVLHLTDFDRIGQTRGVPILAVLIDTLKQLTRFTEAEISAAVTNALLVMTIERKPPPDLAGSLNDLYPEEDENGNPIIQDWDREDNYEFGPGTVWDMPPYQEAKMNAPVRPSSQFENFLMAMCKLVGAALGLPHELIVKVYQGSYSASRGARLEGDKKFNIMRKTFDAGFNQPIYEAFMFEMIAKGFQQANGFFDDPLMRKSYTGAYWVKTTEGSIDEMKDVKSAKERMGKNYPLSSPQKEAAKLGSDFLDVVRECAEADDILNQYGVTMEQVKNALEVEQEKDEVVDV
jgi:lambda family phage portal protein